ncbi:MAG: adenosine deaminase family protein [Pseudolabrys sp.]
MVVLALLALLAAHWDTIVTAASFAEARGNQTMLRNFLHRMPKGGDLHVHLSGAVYAEDFIGWAAAAKLCVQRSDYKIVPPDSQQQCEATKTRPAADALTDQSFYDGIVNALSMRNYLPSPTEPSGHDQFFVTFGKYGEISWRVPGQMTAFLLRRYAAENVQYTELMITLTPEQPAITDELLAKVAKAGDPAAKLAVLKDYIAAAIPEAKKSIDSAEAATAKELGCGTPTPEPGCKVNYRYIAQINRNSDAAKVFANTALAAALVRADPRVVGLNFVGPEDYRIARADYARHMETIGFLTKKTDMQSDVPVALHAGELWLGLVPPEDLTFHIRGAVDTAGAKRIGHGVSLAFERSKDALLAAMREKNVAVEINLTSNDVILGVRGRDHPLMTYLAAGVPVTLSTDDMGVSRIDLTNEYVRAARDYDLDYATLKSIARASLSYSFLSQDDKKIELKRFDTASAAFERAMAARASALDDLILIVKAQFARR